ncbi:MAG: cytochrome b/b6 domain-containing protein [Candidatus Omnitrophica bacterium]|nr:cytochrome b/b6 domain-containing protein [Candidatus Omnitrophota bacterium]
MALTLGVVAAATAAGAENIDNPTCLACHGDAASPRFVDGQKFSASVHSALTCTSCHTDISSVPHAVPAQPVSCSQCHTLEAEVYLRSDHGQAVHRGVTEAASCRDCHGNAHTLLSVHDPASPVTRANIPQTCAQCHGKTQDMAKFRLAQKTPIRSYLESVHGLAFQKGNTAAAVCTDCHGSHDLHRATNPQSKLYWQVIPATCGKCHENIRETFRRSIHGQAVATGKRDAPVCTDCHGEHSIDAVKQATSKVFPSNIPETCGQCHAAERIITKYQLPSHVVDTYMKSFHGLSLQLGSLRAANCASCHGAHDILPSNDPRSAVHPNNLAKTCGQCHPGVSLQVTRGQIHSGTQPGLEHRAVGWVRRLYLILIVTVVGGMLLHNFLDFRKKLQVHRQRMTAVSGPLRMTLNERIQHAVLAIAFIALAYTGFALKHPQAWWASPFVGRVDWRSLSHRGAALVFCVLGAYHIWFVCRTDRGRKHLRALLPMRSDLIQFGQMLGYDVGLRGQRPMMGHYSYVEKIEYWALVWGSMVMVVTGALMTWQDWTLRLFPKWIFDVITSIHYYEAILACLAILLWHGYFTMFDPDEYPMKWTWLTGRPSESDEHHRKEDEPAQH